MVNFNIKRLHFPKGKTFFQKEEYHSHHHNELTQVLPIYNSSYTSRRENAHGFYRLLPSAANIFIWQHFLWTT